MTGDYPQNYSYDAIGNLFQLTRPEDSLGLTFPAPGEARPHAPLTSTKGLSYTYDANGNLTQIQNPQSEIQNRYAYDAENRLAQVISGALITAFGYDGDGERVIRRADSGEVTHYVGEHYEVNAPGFELELVSASYRHKYPAVTYSDGLHVVFSDKSVSSGNELYYARQISDTSWSVLLITDTLNASYMTVSDPTVAVYSGTLHLAWIRYAPLEPDPRLYYSRSTDSGQTWTTPVQLSASAYDTDEAQKPELVIDNQGNLHIIWAQKAKYGNCFTCVRYYHRVSTDGGMSWGGRQSFDVAPHAANYIGGLDIASMSNGQVVVTWVTKQNNIEPAILHFRRRFIDGSWGSVATVAQTPSSSDIFAWPRIAVEDDGTPHILWHQDISSVRGLRYAWSPDNGQTWNTTSVSDEVGHNNDASVHDIAANNAGQVFVAWDTSEQSTALTTGSNGTLSEPQILVEDFSGSDLPLTVDGEGEPHIVQRGSGSIYHVAGGITGNATKRYFANGRQLALRTNGQLYYTLTDPTGTALVLAHENGEEAGRILYDGYGGVLSSTIPATLTNTLPEFPDADTGLVYLGKGRFYDPMLGRPLQPNPVGGPPSVPQALNRYAATSLGPVGVLQAEASSGFATSLWHQTPGGVAGLAIDLTPVSRVVGHHVFGNLEISYLPSKGLAGVKSWFSTSRAGQKLTRLPFGVGSRIAAKYASRVRRIVMPVRLDQGGALADELALGGTVALNRYANARLLGDPWKVPVVKRGSYGALNPWRSLFKTAGVAGIISGGFQVYDDWGNPYLTGEQKVFRAGISTGIGFGAALTGGLVGAGVGSAITPGVGTVVGAVIGFGLGLWGELWLAPRIFEGTDNAPERSLAPLP